MTREEEILNHYYLPRMHWQLVNKNQTLKAMREYAREMSIGFDFWKCTNYEPMEEGNYQGLFRNKYSGHDCYTRSELYTKYLETLNK